jgi:hypothetical protein
MWNMSESDRLAQWRQFRSDLNTVDAQRALTRISSLWSYAPFVPQHLDPEQPSSWPDPWHLLWHNTYDNLAIALGMAYTWQLCQHGPNYQNFLQVYQGPTETINCLWIQPNNWVLNWKFDTVLTAHCVPPTYQLIHSYNVKQLI